MKKILLLIAMLFALKANAQTDTITATYPGRLYSDTSSASCCSGGCTYILPVVLPPAFTVTNIHYSFNYRTLGLCTLDSGGWCISLDSCSTNCISCDKDLPGLCMLQGLSMYNNVKSCIPGPTCSADTLRFVMHFWRKPSLAGGSCSSSCIVGDSSSFSISVFGTQGSPSSLAAFLLVPDTTQLHHYIAINYATGKQPLSYVWSWGDGTYDSIPYPSHVYADSGFYDICLTVTDINGCSSTFCDSSFQILRTTDYMVTINVIPPLLTGITDKTNAIAAFDIFPNPATGLLTIHTSSFHNEAVTLSVVNMLGQTMMQEKLTWNSEESINIKSLSAGIYFVQVSNDSNQRVGKFVKE